MGLKKPPQRKVPVVGEMPKYDRDEQIRKFDAAHTKSAKVD